MSNKAHFIGFPIRRASLPAWARELLPPIGTKKRLRDLARDGLTVLEAVEKGYCKSSQQLYHLSSSDGGGLPGLAGEILARWHEYQVSDDGAVRQFMVFSLDQLKRSKAARAALADAKRNRTWPADKDLMDQYPDLFGPARQRLQRRRQAANKAERRPSMLHVWRNHHCPMLGRKLNSRKENGVTVNDPKDIETIVRKLREGDEREWLDPDDGKTVYVPTWVVEEGIKDGSKQFPPLHNSRLHRHARGHTTSIASPHIKDGYFTPKVFRRYGRGGGPKKGQVVGWPKHQVLQYLTNKEKARSAPSTLSRVKKIMLHHLAGGPLRAEDAIRFFQKETGLQVARLYQVRKKAGILSAHPGGRGSYIWHLPNQDPTKPQTIQFTEPEAPTPLPATTETASKATEQTSSQEQRPAKRTRGRPKGTIDKAAQKRNEKMKREWGERKYDSIQALADAHKISRERASHIINDTP